MSKYMLASEYFILQDIGPIMQLWGPRTIRIRRSSTRNNKLMLSKLFFHFLVMVKNTN
jgi:hypothetical protein